MATDPPPSTTVLVVDDDLGLSRLIQKALQREGFNAVPAASGKEAIMWLARNRADLMLLDLKLQDIEGKELVNHLADIHRSVPFIVITGQGDERVAVDMMKRGALDYLVKDVDFLQFVPTVVRRALDQLDREKRLAEAEEALRRSEADLVRAQQVAHVGSYEFDVPGTGRLHWSAETFRIVGLDPAQEKLSLQEYRTRVVHPDDEARVRAALDRTINEGARYDIEYRIVRPNGTIRHVHSVAEPVLGPDQKVIQVIGALQDITERRELEREILAIAEREQRRFGHDLHDGIGQRLTAMELFSHTLLDGLKEQAPKLVKSFQELGQELRETIRQTRALSHGLSPVSPEAEGLMHALRELAENTSALAKVECRFISEPPALVSDAIAATHLYRIAQEAVTNALKHGKAKRIRITLADHGECVELKVDDNGRGFSTPVNGGDGMGLRVMQYRAGLIGATIEFNSAPRKGVVITCTLRKRP